MRGGISLRGGRFLAFARNDIIVKSVFICVHLWFLITPRLAVTLWLWHPKRMRVDHTEFIQKHHGTIAPDKQRERRNAMKGLMLSALGMALYVLGCIGVAIVFDISMQTVVIAAFSFFVAMVLAFFINRYRSALSAHETQRQLIMEVLEGSRGARLITDGADNPIYMNQKFMEICAPKAGESGLDTLSALFKTNDEAHAHFRNLADQARRGLTDTIELKSVGDNRALWFMVTAQPVAGWAGYIHWRLDDITQQREVNRSIREEREKLIDFTDNAPVGFFSADEQGRFVFVNGTLARWLGESIETLLEGGHLHTFIQDPPQNAKPYDVSEKGGERQVQELTMKGPGGKTFLASISQSVVDEGGGRVRTRAIVHDLTSEKEMSQALKASEDRFQRFFEEAPLGIIIIDSDGKVEDCNAALAGMVGTAQDKVEGRDFKTLILKDDQSKVMDALARIEQGGQMNAPIEITLKDKKETAVQLYARKFKGNDSLVLHFIDLTEQKELEEKFVQSQKMQAIGQLAGGIAHDFNNLLTAIIGYCDLLFLRHKAGDPSFGDIMQIKQNSNRAANLVRQLLAFSRQQTLRPKVHDVSDILTEVSYLLRRLIGANIELELVHGQDLGLVKVDIGQMEQVLINLAVNARDAMAETDSSGGKLTISTTPFANDKTIRVANDDMPAGRWVRVDVTDTGCGIPEENLARILEPFFTTKGVGQGTGLGLATVYGIIRQTGGYLDIKSKVGQGTTFSIYLPRLSDEEAAEADTDEAEDETIVKDLTGTARILLVEDEDAVRSFSARALTNKGYQVLEAESGEVGLEVFQGQGDGDVIDLLITDVIMPGMDGPTLAEKIRAANKDLKIIFISGYTEDKLKDHMGENIYFLPKPFTLKQLASKVKEVLEE